MLLSIIRYIKGYVKIRVSGYSTERFLNACSHRGIYIWGLCPANGAYEMFLSISGFRKLKPIIKKTGTKVAVIGRFGLPFFLHRYRKRKLFFVGAAACLIMIYMMSLYIWDIDIRGNMTRTDETITEFLQSKQVTHGMKKSKVDCPRIVKDIRREFNDIIWVSASVEGTKLVIQVKENEDSIQVLGDSDEEDAGTDNKEGAEPDRDSPDAAETGKEQEPEDIVADMDCAITGIITRKGVPMVKEGDTVKKGDLLVCGRVPVNNDAQETIGYQYHQSDADIYGKTKLNYEEAYPLTYIEKVDQKIEKEEMFIRIGSYRFGLGSRSHNYEHYEVYSKEHRLRIGDSFYLPVSIGKRTIHPYAAKVHSYSKEKLQEILTDKFNRYCEELQKKGVEIIENDVKIYTEPEKAVARGTITVITPVGDTAPTEVLEVPLNDKNEELGEHIDGNDGNND